MSSLVGTASLLRLALRRDRIVLVAFVVILVAVVAASASATMGLYPDASSRARTAAAVNSTASALALYGPIHDETSIGALAMFKMGMLGALAVAVLALSLVVRHTRAEEETGRLELLGAAVVGRRAPLTAALIVASLASLVAGVGTALGLIAVGLPIGGALTMGAGFALLGIVFAAVAGVTAQLVKSARSAAGLAGLVLAVTYLLRAIGDTSAGGGLGWVSSLSPVGWWQKTWPFAGDRWWALAPLLAVALATSALAYALAARRDFAAGLLPDRPGPATAAASLRSPMALAWRLQRGSFFVWTGSLVVLGLVFGGLSSNIDGFLTSPQAKEAIISLGGVESIRDAFLAVEMGMVGVVASVYGVQVTMRLRSEESALRADPLLATAVSRVEWAWSHLMIALVGAAVLLIAVGVSAGLVSAVQVGDSGQFGRVVVGALVQIPAVWLIIGIVAAAFGLVPRFIVVGWVALAAFALVGEFGSLFDLSQTVMDISPFAHVPRLPGGDFAAAPLLWLTAIAAALIALGLAGFRRRDLG